MMDSEQQTPSEDFPLPQSGDSGDTAVSAAPNHAPTSQVSFFNLEKPKLEPRNGRRKILKEEDFDPEELGFGFPTWRKWVTVTVIVLVQVSMNFNTVLHTCHSYVP